MRCDKLLALTVLCCSAAAVASASGPGRLASSVDAAARGQTITLTYANACRPNEVILSRMMHGGSVRPFTIVTNAQGVGVFVFTVPLDWSGSVRFAAGAGATLAIPISVAGG